jgi:hypothetical protein
MRPDFDDAAMLQDHDLIARPNGREPVGDNQRGSVLEQGLQRLLNQGF